MDVYAKKLNFRKLGSIKAFLPVVVAFLAVSLMQAALLLQAGGDPLVFARLGTRYALQDPLGSEGYDGQFNYYIAHDPAPASVSAYLDVPAYRYQRILYPLLGRFFSFGSDVVLPWSLIVINLLAHAFGVWAVAELLAAWGTSRWYALVYGLWAGFTLSLRLDLSEPLAYALIALALLADTRERPFTAWACYGLALFAKEVTIIFIAAQLLAYLVDKRWRFAMGLSAVTVLPFAVFQAWLWLQFGAPGVGSGGAMATSFEIIPFMGLMRIGQYSMLYLAAMLVVFGPSIVLPTLWGLWKSVRSWLMKERNVIVLALFLNALAIPFLPFSTFRETGGLLRFASGLLLAFLLYAGRYQNRRILNYSFFLLVLNMFVFKS